MTTHEENTSLQSTNLAQILTRSGRSGGFIRVVQEVVGEYLGIHANLSPEILGRLTQFNKDVTTIAAANDTSVNTQKTGTHSGQ